MSTITRVPVTLTPDESEAISRLLIDYSRQQFEHARRSGKPAIQTDCRTTGAQALEHAEHIIRRSRAVRDGSEPPSVIDVLNMAEATIIRLNRHDSANGTLDVIRAAVDRLSNGTQS